MVSPLFIVRPTSAKKSSMIRWSGEEILSDRINARREKLCNVFSLPRFHSRNSKGSMQFIYVQMMRSATIRHIVIIRRYIASATGPVRVNTKGEI